MPPATTPWRSARARRRASTTRSPSALATNTYTMAGVASTDSANRQSGDIYLVTSDADGHLAVDRLRRSHHPARHGVLHRAGGGLVPVRHRRGGERDQFDGRRPERQGHCGQRHGLRQRARTQAARTPPPAASTPMQVVRVPPPPEIMLWLRGRVHCNRPERQCQWYGFHRLRPGCCRLGDGVHCNRPERQCLGYGCHGDRPECCRLSDGCHSNWPGR